VAEIKKTALFDAHQKLGGRLIDFGGWMLPVQYKGVLQEHQACREKAGLFDVSHMGEFLLEGPDAEKFLNLICTNDVTKAQTGKAMYTAMCNDRGGIVDDLIFYRLAPEKYLMVVNASNIQKDWSHIQKEFEKRGGTANLNLTLKDESSSWGLLALQGRLSAKIIEGLSGNLDVKSLAPFACTSGRMAGVDVTLARTGYTGEDGFEIFVPVSQVVSVWEALLEAGIPQGLEPCGLGARDTLRLEMAYALYGHELNEDRSPLETGLAWVTRLEKGVDFTGRAAIEAKKSAGVTRCLAGFRMIERGIPREGYPVFDAEGLKQIGQVTSGSHSPTLGQAIGLAFVDKSGTEPGSEIRIGIRGKNLTAEVVKTPFYRRSYQT